MSVTLTPTDLAHCEALSRTLLSPLAAPSINDWRRDVGRAVRTLFRGDAVLFLLPGADGLVYSDDAPTVASAFASYLTTTPDGLLSVADPVLGPWAENRRRAGLDVFDRQANAQLVVQAGHDPFESPLIHDVLLKNGLTDYEALFTNAGGGEALLWILREKPGTSPFGARSTEVLRTFLPAFRAGLDALGRLTAHRTALDAIREPLAVYGLDGRELFRTAALGALLREEPEQDRLREGMQLAAAQAPRLYLPGAELGGASFAPATRTVSTQRGLYTLRATVIGAGLFSGDESVMVAVDAPAAPSVPAPNVLAQRFGLTRREAEVAGLLGEGCTNAAVAERLFISPHTAKRHVERVLDKLGVPSRAGVLSRLLQPA